MKRILGVVLCILLCAGILFTVCSAFYGHLHNCIGEECQFCQVNSYTQKLMRIFLLVFICLLLETVASDLFSSINLIFFNEKQSVNLVVNKVKLSV